MLFVLFSPEICHYPIGIVDHALGVSMASSSSKKNYPFDNARLNTNGAWRPLEDDIRPWIDVKFDEPFKITGVVTQGFEEGFITAYSLQYSIEDDGDRQQILTSNMDKVCDKNKKGR